MSIMPIFFPFTRSLLLLPKPNPRTTSSFYNVILLYDNTVSTVCGIYMQLPIEGRTIPQPSILYTVRKMHFRYGCPRHALNLKRITCENITRNLIPLHTYMCALVLIPHSRSQFQLQTCNYPHPHAVCKLQWVSTAAAQHRGKFHIVNRF